MKAFASWSGGKDCMLAIHRFINNSTNSIDYLINMCNNDCSYSRSHGIISELVREQANCMNIPIIQVCTGRKEYRDKFKSKIVELKNVGITAGVFGDIFLKEHKVWIEELCDEIGIEAIFPLWGENTKTLINEFINDGFISIVVSTDNTKLDNSWLGLTIDNYFVTKLATIDGIDPCAEYGEYHSFVIDGPNFSKPVLIQKGKKYIKGNHNFIEVLKHK